MHPAVPDRRFRLSCDRLPALGPFRLVVGEFDHAASNRLPRRTNGSMHCADSTTAPRFRLSRHRRTTIAFIQPGQQVRQTRPHRPEASSSLMVTVQDFHGLIVPM
jgi:hypothetical protein